MPGLKDLVSREAGYITRPAPRLFDVARLEDELAAKRLADYEERMGMGKGEAKNEPPRGMSPVVVPPRYGLGPGSSSIQPQPLSGVAPSTGPSIEEQRRISEEYRRNRLVSEYDRYLRENGVNDEEINEIIKGIVMDYDTSIKPSYESK